MRGNIVSKVTFFIIAVMVLITSEAQLVYADYADSYPIPELTGNYVEDLIAVAESQIGYQESGTGETIYAEWAGQAGRAWCSEFIAWCANQAGIPKYIVPIGTSANKFREFYSGQTQYYVINNGMDNEACGCVEAADGYIAIEDIKPGDILLIESSNDEYSDGPDHSALCVSVSDGKIHTIEGNVSGEVVRKVRTAERIHGICRPLYPDNGWHITSDGSKYWYENGVRQGLEGRGKEIYDPDSNGWYWLDAIDGGKMATDKDVYQESLAGTWGDYIGEDGERYGKWVRYDSRGHMVKGWDGPYYFDETYGTMAKGYVTIDKVEYHFDEEDGRLYWKNGEIPETGWMTINGNQYWYENHIRQGYSVDKSYRGKEIYDPDSNAWYWLDNIDDGKKATSKDVYQESLAGDWGDIQGEDGQRYGKWVRYDENGHMVKGWQTNENGTYFFDYTYGTMAKGHVTIDGQSYYFDENTGILQ